MYMMASMNGRADFGRLLNEAGLPGTAVEVGTHRGDFAAEFLSTWKGQRLYCVDPWENYDPTQMAALGSIDRRADFHVCCKKLAKYGNRAWIMHKPSAVVVDEFLDGSLDFVYIDGDHTKIAEDLDLWWPKLKPGGVLAGHDIVCPGERSWAEIIQPAVHAFMCNLDVYYVVEPKSHPWSFYIKKPHV